MSFTLSNLTLKNVYKIEIEERDADLYGAENLVVWLYHKTDDDGGYDMSPLWLDKTSENLEVLLHGKRIPSAKPRYKNTKGFSITTFDKAVNRLMAGWCSRKELSATTGLRVSSMGSLLTDVKREYDVKRKRIVLGNNHGESFYTISGKKIAS